MTLYRYNQQNADSEKFYRTNVPVSLTKNYKKMIQYNSAELSPNTQQHWDLKYRL